MKILKNYGLYILFPILSLLSVIACGGEKPVFEEIETIDKGIWNKNNISFTIPVDGVSIDTLQLYDLQIYLRNNNDYPYSNIYLFVNVTAPSGAIAIDTIQYILADDHGKWFGKGFSKLWDNRFPFYSNIRFPNKGDYHIEIRQGMRQDELIGITDVGIRLMERGK